MRLILDTSTQTKSNADRHVLNKELYFFFSISDCDTKLISASSFSSSSSDISISMGFTRVDIPVNGVLHSPCCSSDSSKSKERIGLLALGVLGEGDLLLIPSTDANASEASLELEFVDWGEAGSLTDTYLAGIAFRNPHS